MITRKNEKAKQSSCVERRSMSPAGDLVGPGLIWEPEAAPAGPGNEDEDDDDKIMIMVMWPEEGVYGK